MLRQFTSALIVACSGLVAPQSGYSQVSSLQQGGLASAAIPRLDFSSEELAFATAIAGDPVLAAFYGGNGLKPIFSGSEGQARRHALEKTIASMPEHGIPVARYPLDAATGPGIESEIAYTRILVRVIEDLQGGIIQPQDADLYIHRKPFRLDTVGVMRAFFRDPDPAALLADLAPQSPAYRALQAALRKQRKIVVSANDLPKAPVAVWRVGMAGDGVVHLRNRLASIGFEANGADPHRYDEALSKAILRYQQDTGLQADGVAGPNTIRQLNSDDAGARAQAIMVALERLRWMGGEDLNLRHVWVNIPEYAARIMQGGQKLFETRVVVGQTSPSWRTPEFSDQMEYVVVNPSWNVPRSITVQEYLPKMRANRYAASHLDVVDRNGNVVPRDQIDFSAKGFPYRIRQKPGNGNALGLVKFIFPNQWNIYLHDTPSKSLFANSRRAYSHGCVRVGDPFDLAYQLLSQQTDNPRGVFQRALDSGRETYLKLTPNIPVHLVYFTAYPDETGKIRFYDDVYGRDARIWEQLEKARLDLGV